VSLPDSSPQGVLDDLSEAKDDIVPTLQVVEQILARVLPDWRVALPADDSGRWSRWAGSR